MERRCTKCGRSDQGFARKGGGRVGFEAVCKACRVCPCRVCGRTDREFSRKGGGKVGFDTICKACKSRTDAKRRRRVKEEQYQHQISERRQIQRECEDRERITGRHMLDLVDREAQLRELSHLGESAVATTEARYRAVREIKVMLRGEEIPADVLDAILPL